MLRKSGEPALPVSRSNSAESLRSLETPNAKLTPRTENGEDIIQAADLNDLHAEQTRPAKIMKEKEREVRRGLAKCCDVVGWEYAEVWTLSYVNSKYVNSKAGSGSSETPRKGGLLSRFGLGRGDKTQTKHAALSLMTTYVVDDVREDQAIQSFAKASSCYQFPKGVGTPGRIYETALPEFLPDCAAESYFRFQRRGDAAKCGFHSTFCIPVVWTDKTTKSKVVAAVLVFFTREIIQSEHVQKIVAGTLATASDMEVFNMCPEELSSMMKSTKAEKSLDKSANDNPANGSSPKPARRVTWNQGDDMFCEHENYENPAMEQLLNCALCAKLCKQPTAMMPCMHTFCKECTDKWCHAFAKCPKCERQIESTQPNKAMQEVIQVYLEQSDKHSVVAPRSGPSTMNGTILPTASSEDLKRNSSSSSATKPGLANRSLMTSKRATMAQKESIHLPSDYGYFDSADPESLVPKVASLGHNGAPTVHDTWWEEQASKHREIAKADDAAEFGTGITWSQFMEHTTCLSAIEKAFPGALPALEMNRKALRVLVEEGFDPKKTLFGNSTCPDEVNRMKQFARLSWGDTFNLGGLGGIPFTGKTGFVAFSHHMPDDGGLLVLYASHVGVSRDGKVGYVERHGMSCAGKACGAAIGAYAAVCDDPDNNDEAPSSDYQMWFVKRTVKAEKARIDVAADPMAEVPHVLYDRIRWELMRMIPSDFKGKLALLGGIQINTPSGIPDYFLVRDFETVLYDNDGSMLLKPIGARMNEIQLNKTNAIQSRASKLLSEGKIRPSSSMNDLIDHQEPDEDVEEFVQP